MMRLFLGYLVSVVYAVLRPRAKLVEKIEKKSYLPVVVHYLAPGELDRILTYLSRRGLLRHLDLSFDDAWSTVLESVEVLEKHNVKARLFVSPGQILRGNVWTAEAEMLNIDSGIWRKWYVLDEKTRYGELSRYGRIKKRTLLTKEQIISLSKHPLISIENHTWSHLSAIHRPADEVLEEIRRAQEELFVWTGRECQCLAWPFGRGNSELDELVRKKFNLEVFYTDQGFERGRSRNMVRDGVTVRENISRILCSWPKVGKTL